MNDHDDSPGREAEPEVHVVKRTDWSQASEAVKKSTGAHKSLENIHDRSELDPSTGRRPPEGPEGIVARWKARKISREAALTEMREYNSARLDLMRHQLHEAVRVKKADATTVADQMLARIQADHLLFITGLGAANKAEQERALIQNGDQTSRTIREILARDWPPEMKDSAIVRVTEANERFLDQVFKTLGDATGS